jgi:hypothetical protein
MKRIMSPLLTDINKNFSMFFDDIDYENRPNEGVSIF